VLIFVRDLMLGMFAWMCGRWAVKSFPVSPALSLGDWSDIVTLFLFRPTEMVLSVSFFGSACWILYSLLLLYGKRVFQRTSMRGADRLMHAFVLLFTLYIFFIQLWKMPIPTLAVLFMIVAGKLYFGFRNWALQEEISELIHKK
jgi:hypothetical protein